MIITDKDGREIANLDEPVVAASTFIDPVLLSHAAEEVLGAILADLVKKAERFAEEQGRLRAPDTTIYVQVQVGTVPA